MGSYSYNATPISMGRDNNSANTRGRNISAAVVAACCPADCLLLAIIFRGWRMAAIALHLLRAGGGLRPAAAKPSHGDDRGRDGA